MKSLVLCLSVIVILSLPLALAQNCPLPPVLQPLPAGADIFSDQQEADLGDAMAEQIAPRIKVIDNDDLAAYLRSMGNRLVQYLPPNRLNFRFYLIDLPEPNAFSIAGGRVYVSRKLILFAHSEDELAGVLAHELGHIVTHQSGIYMTRRFREVLGATQVGDRADVFAKYHQYLENYRRKPSKGESEEKEQGGADQVGVFTAFRAGYSSQSYFDILDRTVQTHGQTGSWLSDLFGATKPGQRRLREVVKNIETLPAHCADARSSATAEAFSKWKEQIAAYSDTGNLETLPGLILRTTLKLPLRPDISHLRFSPDGKYLVAQDEGGIHVLTRDPLTVLFYVPAPEARNAEFTPDSKSIIFYTRSLRVETWNIQDQNRTSVYELAMPEHCMQSALSFDGKTLACLNSQGDLQLIDVATNTAFFTKKQFFVPSYTEIWFLMMRAILNEDFEDFDVIELNFSPDDHYLLAGHLNAHLAFDLTQRHEIGLPSSIKDHLGGGFAFLGPNQIFTINAGSPEKSQVSSFPGGERIDQIRIGRGVHLRAVTNGHYMLLGPLKEHPLGLLDIAAKNIPISFKRPTADVYDNVLVSERLDGEIALYQVGKTDPISTVTLPEARLGKLRAAAVSPDLEWVAFSNHTRGGLWNVAANVRTHHMESFQGAWFTKDNVLYADVPKFQENPRIMAAVSPISGSREAYKFGDMLARQDGGFLVVTPTQNGGSRANSDIEIRDVTTNARLWSRHFSHGVPFYSLNSSAQTVLLYWSLAEGGGHEELQNFPDLKSNAGKDDLLFELINLNGGATLGKALVKTNKRSLRVEKGSADGDWLVVTATGNQILLFSLATGAEKAQFFGILPVLVASASMLAIEKDARELDLYDLNTQQLQRRYIFSDPISLKKFSDDGKRLLVLTASQTAYLIDTTAPVQ